MDVNMMTRIGKTEKKDGDWTGGVYTTTFSYWTQGPEHHPEWDQARVAVAWEQVLKEYIDTFPDMELDIFQAREPYLILTWSDNTKRDL